MIQKRHYFYLNAFRLFAALAVLTGHARCEIFATYSMLNPQSQNIWTVLMIAIVSFPVIAMPIFFVLSGFLVGGPAIEKFSGRLSANADTKEFGVAAYNFFVNRLIRIIPPLFVAIIFMILVKIQGGVDFSYMDAFLNLLGLQGVLATDFGHVYWSMAYEIWFYVLIGSILCLGANGFVKTIGILLLAVCGFVFIKLSVWVFCALLFGVLLYFVKERINLKKWHIYICTALLLILHGMVLLGSESYVTKLPLNGIVNLDMIRWGIVVLVGVIMVSLCRKQPKEKWAVFIEKHSNRWAPMTYCLYITHFTVLELFKQVFGQLYNVDFYGIVVYLIVCGVCLFVGWCFYRYFEEPTAKYLKNKYKK